MNILVTLKSEHFTEIFDREAQAKLTSLGHVVYRFDLNQQKGEQEYAAALQTSQADIVMTCWGSPRLTSEILQQAPRLKYLCHVAGEVRPYIDLDVIEAGLVVSNWGDIIARSVAEGTLMMMLAALRRATHFQMELHVRRGWKGNQQPEGLLYQRIGLLGMGAIAQELVALLQPFDCKIYGYDPYITDAIFEKLKVVRLNSMASLFETCRIISIHAASTAETYHLIDRAMLSRLEDEGVIVNTARGAIIDTDALIAELKSGRIFAALDVFEEEPLPENSELRGLEDCLLMPHLAGPTRDRWTDMGNLAVANIENFIQGREVMYRITPEIYGLMT